QYPEYYSAFGLYVIMFLYFDGAEPGVGLRSFFQELVSEEELLGLSKNLKGVPTHWTPAWSRSAFEKSLGKPLHELDVSFRAFLQSRNLSVVDKLWAHRRAAIREYVRKMAGK